LKSLIKQKIILKITDLTQNTNINLWYDFVKRSQWWSSNEIENYQNDQLKKMINHAYQNVPYYNKIFKQNKLDPSDVKCGNDLKKLPILTRQDIIYNYTELIAVNFKDYKPQYRRTGGTTGTPLKYLSDLNSWSLGWALKYRAWEWAGYRLGDKIAILAGASLIPNQKFSLNRFTWNRINGFYPLSMAHSDNESLARYAETIVKKNINFLRGYPSAISVLAQYCLDNNIKLNIKSVITTAEVLTNIDRLTIENAFGCKVFDTYGCADAGGNAIECEDHKGMHVSTEPSIIELVESDNLFNDNKGYEMIFTSLTNYAMPTIRYSPGDLGIKHSSLCTCGRKTILLKEIIGRKTDVIKFVNGRILGGPSLTLIFRNYNLKNYQIVQNDQASLDVNLVINDNYNTNEEKELKDILSYHCGEGIKINFIYVKEIISSSSGKYRFIISNI